MAHTVDPLICYVHGHPFTAQLRPSEPLLDCCRDAGPHISTQNPVSVFSKRAIELQAAGRYPKCDTRVGYHRVPSHTVGYPWSILLMHIVVRKQRVLA